MCSQNRGVFWLWSFICPLVTEPRVIVGGGTEMETRGRIVCVCEWELELGGEASLLLRGRHESSCDVQQVARHVRADIDVVDDVVLKL